MAIKLTVRGLIMGAAVVAMAVWATPALAQGAIKGRILDPENHPASGVVISVECVSVKNVPNNGITTDSDGRFSITGLVFGQWTLVAQKGKLIARPKDAKLTVMPNIVTDVGDLVLKLDESATPVVKGSAPPKGMSDKDAAAHNADVKATEAKFKGANDDMAAGNFDDAITKLLAVAQNVSKEKDKKNAAACSAKLGEVYFKKSDADTAEDKKKEDLANAEKYFLEAISFDPATVDAYNSLAAMYNTEGRFDDAMKMSAEAKKQTAASGVAQNPTAAYNESVVLWNAGKIEAAEASCKAATELDPKQAPPFFLLGKIEINLGKIPEAIKALDMYLTLAPKGPDAETAKAMLAAIKT